ncbi:MAG TPA: aspartate 1-decarboxylase [Deltaproteobacteria bacterium]|nr:MAG: aspartate 1-decarboxylase [Deltaproteobacteria bacterium GWA2_55_82]OGQ62312.1 MAG: aspartate 1-decarboxylase [Deltaproteobacteria bacterium RIFCSPLOWO2_02_FULL_55_12]OIJ74424.1 MAG: aspartate 1-decarboxylase [Deltaproteobacteria bacterium GWC2_55_46]HBG47077.1 aspartate 1-decarboxylase [Deltaproteobacteria bacterium]HCY10864.1 aspartate 1-decarboxylase [Deltaproteobacteria bacterium]
MQRVMLKSKIHRGTVTDANLDYEGSVAIDEALMEAAGIYEFEQVQIYNIKNGNRLTTYAIKGERGSGVISINGAAAHLADRGDLVIIASYSVLEDEEARKHSPVLVYVDADNSIKKVAAELSAHRL